MKIIVYNNYSENNRINKEISNPIEFNGVLREEDVNILNPTILIESGDTRIFRYDYAYIPEFQRYYFFSEPPTIDVNRMYRINLIVDPLMSFKDEFLENAAYVETSLNYGNFYLKDDNLPIQQNTKITTHKIIDVPFNKTTASLVMNCTNIGYSTTTNTSEA